MPGSDVQGTSKITFLGSVNLMWNNCVFLPAVGKQTQFFHIIITEPGKVILEVSCTAAAFDNRLPCSLGQSFLQQPMPWPQDAPKLPPGARGQKYPCFANISWLKTPVTMQVWKNLEAFDVNNSFLTISNCHTDEQALAYNSRHSNTHRSNTR